jgi:GGDEF domain-containing protein
MLESGPISITASFGVALMDITEKSSQPGNYIEVLISNADNALYQAKKEGRNRVVRFSKKLEDQP